MHSSASSMWKDRERTSSSSERRSVVDLLGFWPWHSRMQMKQVCSWHDWHLAKESRSDFFVGLRWQTWHGMRTIPLIFTGLLPVLLV
jgi:hypothetical protein